MGLRFYLSTFLVFSTLWGVLASKAFAAPPAENILLIYYADDQQTCTNGAAGLYNNPNPPGDLYDISLETAFATDIGALASSIQTLQIHAGDVGIYTELSAQYPAAVAANPTDPLAGWCQVYDLRFFDGCDNIGYTVGQNEPDMVTNAGANNDTALFKAYMAAGGSLFLQAEHHDYYARNNNLLHFVNDVASTPVVSSICGTYICPDVNTGTPYQWNNCFTTNYGFNSNDNNLANPTSMVGWFVGGIPAADYGSGLPLITIPSLSYSATSGAEMLGWEGGALVAPYSAGKLVVSFETNAWATANFGGGILQSVYASEALQNVYTLLTGCLHYTVTKSFDPTSLSVGQTGTFTICAMNTGSLEAINNYSISDTIATCLTYNSSTTSVPTSGTGNSSAGAAGTLYWWTFGSIAPGASACVTVNFTAANTTCP